MRKLILFLLAIFLLCGVSSNASAYSYLENWNIDTAGTGLANGPTVIDVYTLFSVTGVAYAEIYDVNPAIGDLEGTFEDWGVWKATLSDAVGETYPIVNGVAVELTGLYDFEGSVVLGGDLTFETGTLDIYLDFLSSPSTEDFYTVNPGASVLGANDGLLIASFDVLYGDGEVSGTGEITDSQDNINIVYESNYLRTGYFVAEDGTDLSTTDPLQWVLGFSNTTAVTGPPQDGIANELYDEFAFLDTASNGGIHNPPASVFMTNNGEFKLAVVPEPTTMFLFGAGLLGLAVFSRKKLLKK